MDILDMNYLAQNPEELNRILAAIRTLEKRLEQMDIDFKFMFQVFEGQMPGVGVSTVDAVRVAVAMSIANSIKTWDGNDPVLPLTMSILATREAMKDV